MSSGAAPCARSTHHHARSSLAATALLQGAGAGADTNGAHIQSSEYAHECASVVSLRGARAPVARVAGRSVCAAVQSAVQENTTRWEVSVSSVEHASPGVALCVHGDGVSCGGALCVERLLPSRGTRAPTSTTDAARACGGAGDCQASSALTSVLLTGGLGALGQTSAAWYVYRGARHAHLTSRRGRGNSNMSSWASLSESFASTVHMSRVDASALDEVACGSERAYTRVRAQGVVHAGGVLRDSLLLRQSASAYRSVWSSKVSSMHALLEKCASMERGTLQVALFSSVAALLGSAGQCNYSSANAALDSQASHRLSQGMGVHSIQWGAWDGAGMALNDPSVLKHARSSGVGVLDPAAGIGAMHLAFVNHVTAGHGISRCGALAVVPFQWSILSRMPRSRVRSLISEFRIERFGPTRRMGGDSAPVHTAPSTSHAQAQAIVTSAVAHALGRDVPLNASLMEEGLDSLAAVELGGALQKQTGVTMPATLAFDYPTITAIAGYIHEVTASKGEVASMYSTTSDAGRDMSSLSSSFERVRKTQQHGLSIVPASRDDRSLEDVVGFIRASVYRSDAFTMHASRPAHNATLRSFISHVI